MDYTTLGRTELRVSRMGLGCGGHSRLGLKTGSTEAEAERVIREALSLGINFIDTAEGYGTEEVVGRALHGSTRDNVIVSTKAGVGWQDRKSTAAEMKDRVEQSLRRLGTDYIDVFHLHGISSDDYAYAHAELLPALKDLQKEGKVRFIGITEAFGPDPAHVMLSRAKEDKDWNVVMVGFNILNQSARERVLAVTQPQRIGTLCMFAVRRALSQPEALRQLMEDLVSRDLVNADSFDPENPLGFLLENDIASSIPDAAYRFCRWEPGIDVVLSGTGQVEHLRQNAASLSRPPLPVPIVTRLQQLFANVDCVSGN